MLSSIISFPSIFVISISADFMTKIIIVLLGELSSKIYMSSISEGDTSTLNKKSPSFIGFQS